MRSRSTLDTWAQWCVSLACTTEDTFWSGARLITGNKQWVLPRIDASLTLEDIGYTKYKLARLNDQYFVKDSIDVAMMLHDNNVKRRRYASSSFHCYGHLLKVDPAKKSKRGSLMGPCIQSVVITLKPHQNRTELDLYYRTTEVFKKFPADLVWLRDMILPLIPGQEQYPVGLIRFHFVNVTTHPMYVATVLPHLPDPVATLRLIADRNPAFHGWAGKWLVRYLVGGAAGRSIEKFAQAQRTAQSAVDLIGRDRQKNLDLMTYLNEHRQAFLPRTTRFDTEEMAKAFDNAMERARAIP